MTKPICPKCGKKSKTAKETPLRVGRQKVLEHWCPKCEESFNTISDRKESMKSPYWQQLLALEKHKIEEEKAEEKEETPAEEEKTEEKEEKPEEKPEPAEK